MKQLINSVVMIAAVAGAVACGGTDEQAGNVEQAAKGTSSTGTTLALGGGLSPAQLSNAGWICRTPPPPFNTHIACAPPGLGFPAPPPAPDGQPTYNFLEFDLEGNFIGRSHMIRADLYAGEPCEATGAPYAFRAPIGYYECLDLSH